MSTLFLDVRSDGVAVLTFDQPVTADAIDQAVALIGSQSGSHNFTASSNGNVVTLAPQPDFFRGEQVTVSISPELQSAAGWPRKLASICPCAPKGNALSTSNGGRQPRPGARPTNRIDVPDDLSAEGAPS